MRDYLVQEIAIYNHFMKLETVFIPELDTKTHKFSSINHLSEGGPINRLFCRFALL